jgi:ESCRT-II complex subunit VPS22
MATRRRIGVGKRPNRTAGGSFPVNSGGGSGPGVNDVYQKKAQELQATSLKSAMETIKILEEKLSTFAVRHKHEIQTDPAFRARFLQLCAPLGVDPLVSDKSDKGLWGKLGLGLEEFYSELSVKVAEVCIATRSRNGGIISVKDVQRKVEQRGTKFNLGGSTKSITSGKRNKKDRTKVSEEDIITAISKLSALGSGFRTMQIGKNTMILSVPTELDSDHTEVMRIAFSHDETHTNETEGTVTLEDVRQNTNWDTARCQRALDLLLGEGMAWLDVHNGKKYYWFPSVWKEGI